MEMYLWMFCSHWQDDWADLLPTAEFAYNNHHHLLIDTTPFFTNYGYHLTLTNVPSAGQSGKTDERIWRIHKTQEECKCTIEWSQEISNKHTINGKMTTLALKSEIQCGLGRPISQLMSPLQSSWARDTVPLRSRTSSQIWLTTLSCLHAGESMIFSMLVSCWKQSLT